MATLGGFNPFKSGKVGVKPLKNRFFTMSDSHGFKWLQTVANGLQMA